ncbi:hypothetical protein B0A48_18353 [Cryoendolithus antarcticus]|uniref:C2H2-type domain-containing protein n=1 Tax=Cryoendolithus antarcticus TaxID=1507870 RepID=A0A1V8SAT5_9PEZI|nr:hypothetical protein B0A48_18353 [Cryoendolithus antarcticus]
MATICEDCDRTFGTRRAFKQHLQDSPVHAVTFDCNECDAPSTQSKPSSSTFETRRSTQSRLTATSVTAPLAQSKPSSSTFEIHQPTSASLLPVSATPGEATQPTAQPGVDEEREDEDLDGTTAPQISAAFIYNSQIQIVCAKKVLNSTVRQHTSGAGTNIPIDDTQRWIEGEVAKLTGYGLSRIVLRVGYERLASEKWLTDRVDGFAVLFNTMQQWSIENKKGIALTVEGQTTAAPTLLPLLQARRSATNNQMAVVGAQREVTLSEGNLAPGITE